MTFSLQQGRVVISSQITHTQSSNIHPLAYILDTAPWFSVIAPFYSLSQLHHVTASYPSPGDNNQGMEGPLERTLVQAKIATFNSINYICTRALYSFPSFVHSHAASTVIRMLPKATFTPSIQPTLGLPHTRPLTSAINTLLAMRYSTIL